MKVVKLLKKINPSTAVLMTDFKTNNKLFEGIPLKVPKFYMYRKIKDIEATYSIEHDVAIVIYIK